eukprot:CAMPEP_0176484992 /NCGR_PEP_ID=MMETSP0200_2-20121128/4806_1 /TAXON_ID=947934 /ORGANISM="Chaetoceros sp., Strain GSL56" /LENGTH=277 /DNA_ID=CAMNT_0017881615 /DNA_START=841 /DNA_END=1674 /DNA_ORIENTATION=-
MEYRFADRRRRDSDNHNQNQPIYTFDAAADFSQGGGANNDFNDGNSLTYSSTSSQAESTDSSSLADIEFLRLIDKEHKYHLLQKQEAQNIRKREARSGAGAVVVGVARGRSQQTGFSRQNSSATENSLGYSTDGDLHFEDESGMGQMFVSTKDGARRVKNTSSLPPGHHAPNTNGRVIFTPAHGRSSTTTSNSNRSIKINNYSRSTPKKRAESDFSSPTMVSTDISTPGSGSDRSGTPTPSTPPPRHVKKMSSDENEVWYQKWWMCGFADALNLNGN